MTLELNASDDRGISVVRQEIQDFASTKSVFSSTFKLIVLDECDAMTKDAQFALRRVIEKYARYGTTVPHVHLGTGWKRGESWLFSAFGESCQQQFVMHAGMRGSVLFAIM